MEFWTSLIKTPETNDFLKANCTHVTGEYWIFEGDDDLLEDQIDDYEIVSEGAVPFLGGLTEKELIAGCEDWFGVKI